MGPIFTSSPSNSLIRASSMNSPLEQMHEDEVSLTPKPLLATPELTATAQSLSEFTKKITDIIVNISKIQDEYFFEESINGENFKIPFSIRHNSSRTIGAIKKKKSSIIK